jgi:uncharacterized protein (DUF488 family)
MTAEPGPHGVIGFGYEGADQAAFVASLARSWNRSGFSGSGIEVVSARDTYRQLIRSGTAPARIDEIAQAAATELVALLCVEADERHCHRYVVLSELRARLPHAARAGG